MTRVAANADDYASTRVGIFFPANNSTPEDGNLTGQCVTLDKWFFAEMSDVPSPFAARGDARYLGDNLVAQGLAYVVPNGQQKRGDIVVYKYGVYGHTGVLLSGNRLFQENANVAGAQRRVLQDGTVVYSSTIVTLYASLSGVAPTFYRLNSYVEAGDEPMTDRNFVTAFFIDLFNTGPTEEQIAQYINRPFPEVYNELRNAQPHQQWVDYVKQVIIDNNNRASIITGLENERDTVLYPAIDSIRANLGIQDITPDSIKAAVDALKAAQAPGSSDADLLAQIKTLQDENAKLKAQAAAAGSDTELLNGFGKWLTAIIARLGVKK